MAITAGVAEGIYFLQDGTIDDTPLRFSYVWIKQDGRWKEAHHHGSLLIAGVG